MAGVAINRYLTLERVASLLAAVVAVGFRAVLGTLHRLLKRVDDHGQFGYILQQAIQGTSPFPPRVRQSHRRPSPRLQNRQDLVDVPSRRRIADLKQVAQRLMVGILAQPHHSQQQPVDHRQRRATTTAYFALPSRTRLVQPPAVALRQLGQNLIGQTVKFADSQTRHGAEYLWVATNARVLKDHDPKFTCFEC